MRIGLTEVLQQLGQELREASELGGGTIDFNSAEVEMEVTFETSASGGIDVWVASGKAATAKRRTTKITVSLGPHTDWSQLEGVGM